MRIHSLLLRPTLDKKLLGSAVLLLSLLSIITALVAYAMTRRIVIANAVALKRQEISLLSRNVEDLRREAVTRLDLLSRDATMTSMLTSLRESVGIADKSLALRDVQFYLRTRLVSQVAFSSLYVAMADMLIGCTASRDTITVPFPAGSYDLSDARSVDRLFALVQDSDPAILRWTPDNLIASRIDARLAFFGVLNLDRILQDAGGSIVIIGEAGRVVFATGGPIADSFAGIAGRLTAGTQAPLTVAGARYIVTSVVPRNGTLRYFSFSPMDRIDAALRSIVRSLVAFDVGIFLLFSVLFYVLSAGMVRPLKEFNRIVDGTRSLGDIEAVDRFLAKHRSRYSIRWRAFLFYSATFIPLALIVLYNFVSFRGYIVENARSNHLQMVKQTARNVELKASSYAMFTREVVFDIQFQRRLSGRIQADHDAGDEAGDASFSHFLSGLLLNKGSLGREILSVELYAPDFRLLYSSSQGVEPGSMGDPFGERPLDESNLLWLPPSPGGENLAMVWRIKLLPAVDGALRSFSTVGYLRVGLRSFLDSFLGSASEDMGTVSYVFDRGGRLVYSSHPAGSSAQGMADFPRRLEESGQTLLSLPDGAGASQIMIASVGETGWTIVWPVPLGEFTKKIPSLLVYNLLIMLAMMVIVPVFSSIAAAKLVRPLRALQIYMNSITTGSQGPPCIPSSSYEYVELAENFRRMLFRLDGMVKAISESEKERSELEKRKREQQVIALQTQMNPHFLYNIFTSINVLIRMGNLEDAEGMVQATGNFLRKGLYRGNVIVHASEEIEHVNAYIELQRIRYRDRIRVRWQVQEGIGALSVPKFILQPVVENAIDHGMETGRNLGIDIDLRVSEGLFRIEVSDDGRGIAPEELRRIRESLRSHAQTGHLGLANVNERIRLHCGEGYGLDLESLPNAGTRIRILMPVVKRAEPEPRRDTTHAQTHDR